MSGNDLRVLHLSTYDAKNGAAKASWRLHDALRGAGHRSRMVVRERLSSDPDVVAARLVGPLRRRWRKLPESLGRVPALSPRAHLFNLDREPPVDFESLVEAAEGGVDVVCLHLLTGLLTSDGVRRLQQRLAVPLVQVFLDLEPATGGCHHPLDCTRYRMGCGDCFQLEAPSPRDASSKTFERKRRNLTDLPLTAVAPTGWLARRLEESALYANRRVESIPLALDLELFRPIDRAAARQVLGLPERDRVIFFGAYSLEDERKGMRYLREALDRIRSERPRGLAPGESGLLLLIAGSGGSDLRAALPFESRFTGWIRDDVYLALAYQAADVFACPSVYDAGPMMIPEALLCGTPVVAFDSGGAPDLVVSGENGYLARWRDAEDFSRGLLAVLEHRDPSALSRAAREAAAARHDPRDVAKRYTALFRRLREAPP